MHTENVAKDKVSRLSVVCWASYALINISVMV